jgi:hypothetical protein
LNIQLKIAGDALLVLAGLFTVLGKIFPSVLERWGQSLTKSLSKRALAPGEVVKYSLFLALGALVLLAILVYTIGDSKEPIWGSVLAALFVIGLIGSIYVRALQYAGRTLMKRRPRKYLAFRGTITTSNWLLFFASLVLIGSVIGVSTLYSRSSQNLYERVPTFLYIIPIATVGVSLLIPSFAYLVTCEALQLPRQLSRISARLFWRVVLVMGLIGSVLLLIDDVIK